MSVLVLGSDVEFVPKMERNTEADVPPWPPRKLVVSVGEVRFRCSHYVYAPSVLTGGCPHEARVRAFQVCCKTF